MCKILSRIKILADTEGITIGTIERTIGASRGVISKAIAKGTDIQSKWLELICENFPKYSPLWLLTGQGSMFREDHEVARDTPMEITTTPPEKNIASDMRQLSQSAVETSILERCMTTIREQAEEIGRLKERIAQLEREKNVSVPSYQTTPRRETVESL